LKRCEVPQSIQEKKLNYIQIHELDDEPPPGLEQVKYLIETT
jgi:hypothetical protein